MPARSPSRIFLARARPVRDRLDETTAAELRAPPSTRAAPDDDPLGDVLIDLTGPTPSWSRTRRPPTGGPRWRARLPLAALLVLVAAAAGLAAANYSAALQWRERAEAAEQRARQAEGVAVASRREAEEARRARRVASRRRSALADQLAVSEADVVALEARLVALASDRARAEDLGGAVGGTDPEALLRSLRAQVDSCVAQVEVVRSGLVGDADVDAWQGALTAAEATCAQAASDIDALTSGG